jgi:hypothetical protein
MIPFSNLATRTPLRLMVRTPSQVPLVEDQPSEEDISPSSMAVTHNIVTDLVMVEATATQWEPHLAPRVQSCHMAHRWANTRHMDRHTDTLDSPECTLV